MEDPFWELVVPWIGLLDRRQRLIKMLRSGMGVVSHGMRISQIRRSCGTAQFVVLLVYAN
jgi:hypothetical protein